MYESSDVRLENVRVINGPGMGILPIHTKNIYLDKVRFMYDHESEGIITNQADAVHAFACSGDFSFTDCVFEGMIDDAINIHSQFYLLEKMDGNHITLKHTELGETTANTIFAAGDRIGIHRGQKPVVSGNLQPKHRRSVEPNPFCCRHVAENEFQRVPERNQIRYFPRPLHVVVSDIV